jgi:hypothetical protein
MLFTYTLKTADTLAQVYKPDGKEPVFETYSDAERMAKVRERFCVALDGRYDPLPSNLGLVVVGHGIDWTRTVDMVRNERRVKEPKRLQPDPVATHEEHSVNNASQSTPALEADQRPTDSARRPASYLPSNPLAYQCPSCSSGRGTYCVSKDGKTTSFHKARRTLTVATQEGSSPHADQVVA